MQVTTEYVEEAIRSNCFPVGYLYTAVLVSSVKSALADDIPADYRMKFLERLDLMANDSEPWLTAEAIAAIEPMCPRAEELYNEAAKLDRGKPGRPGFLDALAKFFPAFAVLNPSLMTALELQPRRARYHRVATPQD